MGWTSYNSWRLKDNGKVDVKAECDSYFDNEPEYWEVLKSCVVHSVYYAAIKIKETGEIFAVVFVTDTSSFDGCNFAYKDMTETMGPFYYECPDSILNLLTETDDEDANEWREKCRYNNKAKRELGKLPVGSVICFKANGNMINLEKCAPCSQFKSTWWHEIGTNCYVRKKDIPVDYKIVATNKSKDKEVENVHN